MLTTTYEHTPCATCGDDLADSHAPQYRPTGTVCDTCAAYRPDTMIAAGTQQSRRRIPSLAGRWCR